MTRRALAAAWLAIGWAGAAGSAWAADLNLETARLERGSRRPGFAGADARRLAEIYFLTSRCDDVKALLKSRLTDDTKELACACGGHCAAGTRSARLSRLRAALERAASFDDRPVQALWRELSRLPEAQHLVLRYLGSSPKAHRVSRLRQLRGELEKNLESLEVKP